MVVFGRAEVEMSVLAVERRFGDLALSASALPLATLSASGPPRDDFPAEERPCSEGDCLETS
jgi:hypothetical protein